MGIYRKDSIGKISEIKKQRRNFKSFYYIYLLTERRKAYELFWLKKKKQSNSFFSIKRKKLQKIYNKKKPFSLQENNPLPFSSCILTQNMIFLLQRTKEKLFWSMMTVFPA